jgi:hypothetical protein
MFQELSYHLLKVQLKLLVEFWMGRNRSDRLLALYLLE